MSKIIRAINVIISNQNKISNVVAGESGSEYFFLYDNKYKWSVLKMANGNSFKVFYYLSDRSLEDFAIIPDEYWENYSNEYVCYSSDELKSREAVESMQELYRIVKEKLLGIDDILDEIIKSDESDSPF